MLLAFVLLTCALRASDGLPVRNSRSVALAFLRFTPRSHTLKVNESCFSYTLIVANEFRQIGQVDEDAETWRLGLEYSAWSPNGEWSVEAPILSRSGGMLDPLINWWHDGVLGDPNPIRDSTPRGRARIEIPGTEPFDSALGVGDVSFGYARQLGPLAVGRVGAKLPTGNPSMLTGSGGFDVGAAIDLALPITHGFQLGMSGSYVFQGRAPRLGQARRTAYASAIAFTWEPNGGESWILQWNTEQSPTVTGNTALDGDHRVISFGYTRKTGRHGEWQAYFSEDGDFRWFRFPGGATIGPDFTLGIKVVRRIR